MTKSGIPYKRQKPKQPPDEVGIPPPSSDIPEPRKEIPPPIISITNEPNLGSQPQFLYQTWGGAFNTSEELQAHTTTEHPKRPLRSIQREFKTFRELGILYKDIKINPQLFQKAAGTARAETSPT
jgi:hypothetical protein